MRSTLAFIIVFAAARWAFPQEQAGTAGGPQISFEEDRVVARAVTPGAEVVWFAVAWERGEWMEHLRRWQAVAVDEDADGIVEYRVEGGVPARSVWAVADLATGGFSVASPPGFPVFKQAPFPSRSLEYSPAGRVLALGDERRALDLLAVRPKRGAWVMWVRDGGARDSDGAQDGRVRASFEDMRPLGKAHAGPGGLEHGDLLVGIDPSTMQVIAAFIGAGGR